MPGRTAREPEPRPLAGASFEEGDFHSLSESCASDPQFNDRRLKARRKLLALGKEFAKRAEGEGARLECRTSLHHPASFNRGQVRRLWAYLCRSKAEKARLRRVLGPELAADLDAAYRNAYLCVALEAEAVEVSLRVHPDAWYDGQNLVNRLRAEGLGGWLERLNELDGFRLRLDDWKGEWRCGELGADRLEEYLGYYRPGETGLAIERRWPAPAGARGPVLGAGVPMELVAEGLRLVPVYRFLAWSEESDFLFQN